MLENYLTTEVKHDKYLFAFTQKLCNNLLIYIYINLCTVSYFISSKNVIFITKQNGSLSVSFRHWISPVVSRESLLKSKGEIDTINSLNLRGTKIVSVCRGPLSSFWP